MKLTPPKEKNNTLAKDVLHFTACESLTGNTFSNLFFHSKYIMDLSRVELDLMFSTTRKI